jgi:hypothetical protein
MYNLNPVVNTDGSITVGSGLDSADISYGFQGGGGLASGVLPGYIRAEEMYDTYGYYAIQGDDGQINYEKQTGELYLIKAYDETGIPLANAVGDNYYYTDGVFTFALSSGQSTSDYNACDTIEDIWKPDANTGKVKVDNISLTQSGWEIERGEEGKYYFQPMELVTSLEQLNGEGLFYVGTKQGDSDEDSNLYVMNLLSKGSSVPAVSRAIYPMEEKGTYGLMYSSYGLWKEDIQYAVDFNNITPDNSGNIFNITLANPNNNGEYNSLGVGVTGKVLNTKAVSIYSGEIGEDTSFTGKISFISVTYKVSYNIVAQRHSERYKLDNK